jgi:hypothetical protein
LDRSVVSVRRIVPSASGLFFGLVTESGTAGRADGATDDRARRASDGHPNARAGQATGHAIGTCAGFVVAFSRLTGDAAEGANRATDQHRAAV